MEYRNTSPEQAREELVEGEGKVVADTAKLPWTDSCGVFGTSMRHVSARSAFYDCAFFVYLFLSNEFFFVS